MSLQGVPLLYVPLEIVMSKYYGESERLLGQVFSLANELPNGAIIFLDEVCLDDRQALLAEVNFCGRVHVCCIILFYAS